MHEFRIRIGGARVQLTRWSLKEAGALRARGFSSQSCPGASPGKRVPQVQGSTIHSLASQRRVCPSAVAGAGASGLVPWSEGCLCPGSAPVTSPGGESGICSQAWTWRCSGSSGCSGECFLSSVDRRNIGPRSRLQTAYRCPGLPARLPPTAFTGL